MAVEPWLLNQNAVSGQSSAKLTLADFQKKLEANFVEIFSFERDAYGNLKVDGIGLEQEGTLFVDPGTGETVTAPQKLAAIFDFSRDLHRSLFLKTPGRILVGLASLALVFLAVSGIGLHLKRAGGLRAIFGAIKVLDYKRDGHAQWSRLLLVPILIIALSGVYLSAVRFAPVPPPTVLALAEAKLDWAQLPLAEVDKVTYPVLEGEPMVIELKDKVLHVDKAKGVLTKVEQKPFTERLKVVNFWLHTGEGTIGWAGVLLVTSLVMVFLSITGLQMMVQKLKLKASKPVLSENADITVLVGSETGHTWRFAQALAHAYQQLSIKVNLLGMEHLSALQGNHTLLLLTSTYGDGEAPENARDILAQIGTKLAAAPSVQFGVLGFGAREYPGFCAFAETLRNQMLNFTNTVEVVPYMTVDNQSVVQFVDWVKALNHGLQTNLKVDTQQLRPLRKKNLATFQVIEKRVQSETFLLKIGHAATLGVRSGDLLGVYPPTENVERYYSIAKVGPTTLLLVIKRTGLCSNYLGHLAEGECFEAFLKHNPTFYHPTDSVPVLMIANGTGIAPFLGMFSARSTLFWGGRYLSDTCLFEPYLGQVNHQMAFSREVTPAYVQDILVRREDDVVQLLEAGGYLMICGSLDMLRGVWQQLDLLTAKHHLPSAEVLKKQGRILTDCY